MITLIWKVYSLILIGSFTKDLALILRTAKLSDSAGNIQITLFTSLVNKMKEDNAFSFENMRFSRFQSHRLIKSTEQTIVIPFLKDEFEILEDGNKFLKQFLHINIDSILSAIPEMKHCSFLCKSLVDVKGDLFECSPCHNIFSSSKYSTSSLVKFVVAVGETSLRWSSPSIVIE